jgi:uncharacterized protein (DUF849 family)
LANNIYHNRSRTDNAQAVQHVVRIAQELNCEMASSIQTRQGLGLSTK